MKRILQITATMDRAGAETMIMNLYRVIDKTQIQFDFLYFTSKKCDFDEEIESLGGKIYRIVDNNPIRRMQATIKLLKQNPQWQTVHAHTLFSNAFHVYAAYKAGVKQRIAHSHNVSSPSTGNFVNYIYHLLSRKILNKYPTHYAACSIAAGEYLFPQQKNVKMIPNSIDTKFFATIAENNKDYLRKQFDIPTNSLIILQLGRFNAQKNHRFSIEIAKELKNNNILFKLFFAGQGALLDDLQKQVKEMDLEKEIIFLGMRTDVAHLLAGSDLMLMPSLYEGLGVVLIEAQAAGIPSIISTTIPADADLKMDLVFSLSLEMSPKYWADKIVDICVKRNDLSKEERLLKLKNGGFDNYSNVKEIEALYKE